MTRIGWTILAIVALVVLGPPLAWGTCYVLRPAAAGASQLEHVDPAAVGGWYEVTDGEPAIRYNPRTGESWILACPGPVSGCKWDPIDVREGDDG